MAITDELRELKGRINTLLLPGSVLALRSEINRIADRIDAGYETLERRIDELCEENEKIRQERAYAYETGYIDGSTHYELEHCPACKNVADLQEALAENAKLRGARDVWQENDAKLRELVTAMKPFLCCMPFASCNTLAANVRNRMRELGISEEV